MGLRIEDGTGGGFEAEVNAENRLVTESIITSDVEWLNSNQGVVWNLPLDGVAPSGATYFFYLYNSGAADLHVTFLSLNSSAAGLFRFEWVGGTQAGGTDIIANTLNLGKARRPQATIQTGASITGLTAGANGGTGLIAVQYLPVNVQRDYVPVSDIVISTGYAVALKAPAAATVNGFMTIYQES